MDAENYSRIIVSCHAVMLGPTYQYVWLVLTDIAWDLVFAYNIPLA